MQQQQNQPKVITHSPKFYTLIAHSGLRFQVAKFSLKMDKFLLILAIFVSLEASALASGPIIECRYMSALSYAEHSVFGE